MKVDVLLFGAAKEAAGLDRVVLELDVGARVRDLLDRLVEMHPGLGSMVEFLKVAVNRRVEGLDVELSEGDEVALLPPMGGGQVTFEVSAEPVDPEDVLSLVRDEDVGAAVLFLGTVRATNRGRQVVGLDYEAYEEMAVERMESEAGRLMERFSGVRLAGRHRTGNLVPGDVSLVVAASAPHRQDAFEACRLMLEYIKHDVPIFKRERYADGGSQWLEPPGGTHEQGTDE